MGLFDTDVLIDVQRKHPPATAWFNALVDPPDVPGFVAMELVQAARNKLEAEKSLLLISPLKIVWPSESECAWALTYFVKYHLSTPVRAGLPRSFNVLLV